MGKLAGIPIAIKDNINIKGEITTCGSKFLANYRSLFNATVIKFIEEEDGLIIGKTNLDEFAMGSSTEHSSYHTTLNPWDLSRSPGGSSGGSASAVASRLAPLSLGSDTGGSIRQPASLTGTVGFKPTYGMVSRFGLVAFGSSLDQIGPFSNSVKDAALIMEVIARHCKYDSTSQIGGPKRYLDLLDNPIDGKTIGVPWGFLDGLEKKSKDAFEKSISHFKDLGLNIIDINLPTLKYSLSVYYVISNAEASTNLARFDGIRYGIRSKKAKTLDEVYKMSREDGFGPEVKQRILLGTFVLSSGYQDEYYKKAQKIRTLIIRDYEKAFNNCDLIAMPTSPSTAFPIGGIRNNLEMYLQDLYTVGPNLAGLPAINIPIGNDDSNLPFGIQLIGPQLSDSLVLNFAYKIEQFLNIQPFIPPIFDKEMSIE